MNVKIATLVLATVTAVPAWSALAASNDPVDALADITGLSERKVQMVLGNRTAFAEYRYTYDRALARFTRTVGPENHQRLMRGESVTLQRQDGLEVVIQLPLDTRGTVTL